jgi:two-component system, cell cycle sensor histidine kinase and response regulator CckA
MSILLVDDEPALRAVAARALRRARYDVFEAASAREAFALFDQHAAAIGLLISDFVMPDIDGPALAQALIGRNRQLPVLFISGYPRPALLDQPQLAAMRFLQKPFHPAALVSAVHDMLTVSTDGR